MVFECLGAIFLESENHNIRKFSLIVGNYNKSLNPAISLEGYYDQRFLECDRYWGISVQDIFAVTNLK